MHIVKRFASAALLSGLQLIATTGSAQQEAPSERAEPAEPSQESDNGRSVDPIVRTAHNALYVELLGNALFYSLNYERIFGDSWAARIGVGYFSVSVTASSGGETASSSTSVLTLPLMANYLGVGSRSHKFELGVGVLLIYVSGSVDTLAAESDGSGIGIVGSGSLAYRYVPYDGGFNFKIGLMPLFGAFGFLPWPGMALGAVF